MAESLLARRHAVDEARRRHAEGDAGALPEPIASSWERCRVDVPATGLPDARGDDAAERWDASPLRAAGDLLGELREVATSEGYLAAITDPDGRILWSDGSADMRRNAERANFVPGADWSESSAGTNAPALSLLSDRPATVFAGEHWCEPVHEWVCYAAPVHDATGAIVGCIDLSSTWRRANDMASATVRAIARLVDARIAQAPPVGRPWPSTVPGVGLRIELLGAPEVHLGGRRLRLTLRQIEILAVLALRGPSSLGELHAHVYGDRPVSPATLKAEISHLRKLLGGGIGSRPYRLDLPVTVDVEQVRSSLRAGALDAALTLYRGQLLPDSESPMLTDERHHLDVVVRSTLLASGGAGELVRYADLHPHDAEVVDAARRRLTDADACAPQVAAALDRLHR